MTKEAYQGIDRELRARQDYDQLFDFLSHLPDARMTRATPVSSSLVLLGEVRRFIVQTSRSKDYGFVVFIEIADKGGLVRVALPDRVVQAIYRQRQSLVDRSTPESRARQTKARQREKQRREREARRAKYQARNGYPPQ
ncbi:MAG TPA: hypothetical protein VJB57_01805 [Dehalococcoidia bacterium]|nr:hypothetical protein [Dehalococcoidia bacterium]